VDGDMSKNEDTHFKIIIPAYNSKDWIWDCILSVYTQSYDNYECIITDDCSTDGTLDDIKKFIKKFDDDNKFVLIENKERLLAFENMYNMIETMDADDEDVVVTLDGDDWLAGPDVLSYLNGVYSQNIIPAEEIWMTYGSYINYPEYSPMECYGHVSSYPDWVIEDGLYREDSCWRASHLRTFKYFLVKQLSKEDWLDDDGTFYEMAWDQALMFPMLEMARERVQWIDEMLYVYNKANPISDYKVDVQKQLAMADRIRARRPIRERLER
jgi:glycosyltransferase involved in cell wall biosynthesis